MRPDPVDPEDQDKSVGVIRRTMLLSAETRELLQVAAVQGTTSASPTWRPCSTGPVTGLVDRQREVPDGRGDPVGVSGGQRRGQGASRATDSARVNLSSPTGVAVPRQCGLREVISTRPGPAGISGASVRGSSALSELDQPPLVAVQQGLQPGQRCGGRVGGVGQCRQRVQAPGGSRTGRGLSGPPPGRHLGGLKRQLARPPAALMFQIDQRASPAGPGHGSHLRRRAAFPPSRPARRGRFAVSSSGCSSRACPSTSSTSVASRTIAHGYRSHRWAWAGWLHQPCRSGSCPCRRRSGISRPCRDAASSDTNVRNTSAGRGPTGPDDMTGPPSKRRTECRAHQGVPVMRPPTLLPPEPTDTAARQTCAERSGNWSGRPSPGTTGLSHNVDDHPRARWRPHGRAGRPAARGRGINRGAKQGHLEWLLWPSEVQRGTGVTW